LSSFNLFKIYIHVIYKQNYHFDCHSNYRKKNSPTLCSVKINASPVMTEVLKMSVVSFGHRFVRLLPTRSLCGCGSIQRNASESSSNKSPSSVPPPYVANSKTDWHGPPDKVSHIRSVFYPTVEGESKRRRDYRLAVEDATSWNHEFWHKRNTEFFAAREKFVRSSINKARVSQVEQTDKDNSEAKDQSPRPSTTAVSTEEMSRFYSKFLSDNHQAHLLYMKGWYLRNFRVLKTGLMWFLSEIKIGRR